MPRCQGGEKASTKDPSSSPLAWFALHETTKPLASKQLRFAGEHAATDAQRRPAQESRARWSRAATTTPSIRIRRSLLVVLVVMTTAVGVWHQIRLIIRRLILLFAGSPGARICIRYGTAANLGGKVDDGSSFSTANSSSLAGTVLRHSATHRLQRCRVCKLRWPGKICARGEHRAVTAVSAVIRAGHLRAKAPAPTSGSRERGDSPSVVPLEELDLGGQQDVRYLCFDRRAFWNRLHQAVVAYGHTRYRRHTVLICQLSGTSVFKQRGRPRSRFTTPPRWTQQATPSLSRACSSRWQICDSNVPAVRMILPSASDRRSAALWCARVWVGVGAEGVTNPA